ncbi:GlxA family transcriptional regulator [Pseudomonas corrugata]|uniref:GlxA family transcriptional regulator n=1 Tax=Pseudomonas corrugata TaxID=47879 RepID=UPI0006D88932|nr:helix-turn-helix domain-containing protein [Pseudomonas corrugata]
MNKQTRSKAPTAGRERRRIVILGLPPVDALDVVGPLEVFAFANSLHGKDPLPYEIELVTAGAETALDSSAGVGFIAHRTLKQEIRDDRPIDTLIVATSGRTLDQLDKAAIDWIRVRSAKIRRVCSICVAAFVLAETGLLDGRRATTHWRLTRRLADRYPKVSVDPDPIWVKDGNVYTSAGVSAGIDLALGLVSEDLGGEVALAIARNMVLFLRRPGGQAQFSVSLQSQQTSGSTLDELRVWISEHLHQDLTVDVMADRLSTSVRTLIRMFQREFKTTPAKYVEEIRVEAARQSIELGVRSMEEVARRCGYRSVDVLRKAFIRRVGVSPKEYAQRFAPDAESA